MAANLMARAAKQLRAKNETDKRRRIEKKQTELMLIGHGTSLAGGVAAALIDEKWSGNQGTAEIKGLPTNALLGTAACVGGAMAGGRTGAALLGGGIGLLTAFAYQMTRDKVEFEQGES